MVAREHASLQYPGRHWYGIAVSYCYRLGLHLADLIWIGAKLDTVRFTYDSELLLFRMKVCVNIEWIDNFFARSLRGLLGETVLFALFENFFEQFSFVE